MTLLNGAKIIFVFDSLELGGAERQGLNLALFLKAEHGADVQIWGLTKTSGRFSQLCDEVGIPWRGIPFKWPLGRLARLKQLAKFICKVRSENVDILLPYTWLPNIVCGLTWKFAGVKTCIWNQRDEGLALNKTIWHRYAVRLTPRFFSNSRVGKNFLLETYGLDSDNIAVIHNGVTITKPVDDRKSWRQRLCVSDEHVLACMIANLHSYKDHATLLRAWRKVVDSCSTNNISPVLILAGRFAGKEYELKALAFDLELVGTVKFLGKVDDISGLLYAVDLCVHSSKTEGCPNAILESMAAGLPVVGTDILAIRDVVSPDSYDFLAAPEDSIQLADSMLKLIFDKELRSKIGNANLKHIDKFYSLEKMCINSIASLTAAVNKSTS